MHVKVHVCVCSVTVAVHSIHTFKIVELPTMVHIFKIDAMIQNLSVASLVSISNMIVEETFQFIHSLYMI